ncbi:MAG: YVTN family beta-propeller protein [Acidimicrobiales bacterium]|jgi:YVTN family beta-propeller protein
MAKVPTDWYLSVVQFRQALTGAASAARAGSATGPSVGIESTTPPMAASGVTIVSMPEAASPSFTVKGKGPATSRRPRPLALMLAAGVALVVLGAAAVAWRLTSDPGGETVEPTAPRVAGTVVSRTRETTAAPTHVVTDIAVGDGPVAGAASDDSVRVPNFRSDSVSRIDIATGQVVATVAVDAGPFTLAIDGDDVWVASFQAGTVSRIEGATNEVVLTVATGAGPSGLLVEVGETPGSAVAAGNNIWVNNRGSGSVSRIDPASGLVAEISVGLQPDTPVAFLGNIWVSNSGSNTISRIDIASSVVVGLIKVGDGPKAVAVDGSTLWVANYDDGTVSRIEADTEEVLTISVGEMPWTPVVVDSVVWVPNTGSGTMSRIDILTNTVVATVDVGALPTTPIVADNQVWVPVVEDNRVSRITPAN